MAKSTYDILSQILEEKLNKENAGASNKDINYASSRMASQQIANQQRTEKQSSILESVNTGVQQKKYNDYMKQQEELLKQQQYQQVSMGEDEKKDSNWWEDFWAKTNEILLTLGYAVMKPVESIVDLGALGIGWIGEKTGNEALSKNMKGFAARDLSKEAQTNPWAQILMPSYSIGFTQDVVNSAIKGKWDVGMDSSLWKRSTNEEIEAPEWMVNTAEGVGQAVGYALISFATGGIGGAAAGAGASVGSKVAGAAAQYAPIFLSATGSATNQALQEGASYDDAFKYGVLSGATEAVSEAFIGSAVNKVLGGAGSTIGGFGAIKKMTSKGTGGASILRNLIASANEEGAEEIFSSVLDPIWKSITYKNDTDKTFIERYQNEFNENGGFMGIVQDYLLGAASSLVLGGAETAGAVVRSSDSLSVKGLKRGLQNVKLSANISEIAEIKDEIANEKLKLKFGETTNNKIQSLEAKLAKVQKNIETKFVDLLNNLDAYVEAEKNGEIKKGQKTQLETIKSYNQVKDVNTDKLALGKALEQTGYNLIDEADLDQKIEEVKKILETPDLTQDQYHEYRNQLSKLEDIKEELKSSGMVTRFETNEVFVKGGQELKENVKTILHERLHIAVKDTANENKANLNAQIKDYMIKDLGKEQYDKLLEEQKVLQKDLFAKSKDYQKAKNANMSVDAAIKSGKFDYWFEEEVSADYLFNLFKNPQQAIKVLNGINGGKGLANSLRNVIRKQFLGKSRPKGYKEILDLLQKISQEQVRNTASMEKAKDKIASKVSKNLNKLDKQVKKAKKSTDENVKTNEKKVVSNPNPELARAKKSEDIRAKKLSKTEEEVKTRALSTINYDKTFTQKELDVLGTLGEISNSKINKLDNLLFDIDIDEDIDYKNTEPLREINEKLNEVIELTTGITQKFQEFFDKYNGKFSDERLLNTLREVIYYYRVVNQINDFENNLSKEAKRTDEGKKFIQLAAKLRGETALTIKEETFAKIQKVLKSYGTYKGKVTLESVKDNVEVRRITSQVEDEYSKVHRMFTDTNNMRNEEGFKHLTYNTIKSRLQRITDFERTLQDYRQVLVDAGVEYNLINQKINELKGIDFADVFEAKEKLQEVYNTKYAAKSTTESVNTTEEIQKNLNTQTDKTELGNAVADTLTNEFKELTGLKFVFKFDAEILDDLRERNAVRKERMKQALINGMWVLDESGKAKLLKNFNENNSLRISIEAFMDTYVDLIFKSDNISEETKLLIENLKERLQDTSKAYKQQEKVIRSLENKNKKLQSQLDKYEDDIPRLMGILKEMQRENRTGKEYQKMVNQLEFTRKRNVALRMQLQALRRSYDRAISQFKSAVENSFHDAVIEMRANKRKIASLKAQQVKLLEEWASDMQNLKGKYKTNPGYMKFLHGMGEFIAQGINPDFRLNDKGSIDRMNDYMANADEVHKVTILSLANETDTHALTNIGTYEYELPKAEIAKFYFWNKVMGNEIKSPYIFEEHYKAIQDYLKDLYKISEEDINFVDYYISQMYTGELSKKSLNDMALKDAVDKKIEKLTEKFEKSLNRLNEARLKEHAKYLNARKDKSLYVHSNYTKARVQSLVKRFEAYKKKFGRLSGIHPKYFDMLNDFITEVKGLSNTQITNGEYIDALKQFYSRWQEIKQDIEVWNSKADNNPINIEMSDELEQMINLVLVQDTNFIEKEDIDLFSHVVTGIKNFMNEAKEHRTVIVDGEVVSLQQISQKGIDEQAELNKKGIKEKFRFINSYLNPRMIFDRLSGYQRNGIYNKIFNTLEQAQEKYASNYMALSTPLRAFIKDYSKEYHTFKKAFNGDIEVDGQKLDATYGQLLTLYQSIKRMQAMEHLATSGFDLGDNKKITFNTEQAVEERLSTILKSFEELTGVSLTDEQKAEISKELKTAKSLKKVSDFEEVADKISEIIGIEDIFTYEDVKVSIKSLRDAIHNAVEEKILKLKADIENALNLNEENGYSEYIKLTDEFFRKAKDLKVEADMQINGFTNANDDYYFPIRVSAVDLDSDFSAKQSLDDMDARQYSFNQNVVSNMGSLLIMDIDDIVDRHLNNTATYNAYSPAIETFKRIYNWKQKRGVTLKQQTQERFGKDGAKVEKFFMTLMKDIQGSKYMQSNTEQTFNKAINYFRSNAIAVALGANPKVYLSQLASLPAAMKYISLSNLAKGTKNLFGKVKGLPKLPSIAQLRKLNSEVLRSETITAKGEINKIGEATTKPIQWFDSMAINSIWYASLLQTKNVDGSWNIESATNLFTRTLNETQPNYNALGRPEILRSKNPLLRMFVMYKTQALQNFSNAYDAVSRMIYKLRRGIPLEETIKDKNGKVISYGDRDKAIRSIIALFLEGVLFTAIGYLFKRIINNDWGQDTNKHLAEDLGIGFINDNLLGMLPIINKIQIDLDEKFKFKINVSGWTDNIVEALEKLKDPTTMSPKDWTTLVSNMLGIPFTNMYKYTKSILQYVLPSDLVAKIDTAYAGKKITKQVIRNTTNERLSYTYYNIYNKDIMNLSSSSQKEMYRLYKNGNTSIILNEVPQTITYEEQVYSVMPKQFNATYGRLSKQLDKVITSSNYKKLSDEQKGWQIKKLIDIYYGASKKSITGENFTKFENLAFYGYTFSSNVLSVYLASSNLEATKTKKRSVVVQQYINRQAISVGEKYLLWWLNGYGLTDAQKGIVRRYLAQNGVNQQKVKEVLS